MVELLSPARDFTSLKAALINGADAVYIGLDGHNMRAHATNFQLEDIPIAVELTHQYGARLYLCTNIVMRNRDIALFKEVLPEIKSAGVDAIIVSDLGVLKIAQDMGMDVHFSIQANISNYASLDLLKGFNVKRVVLSRELSLSEIKEIASNSPLEIEVFVHGAMCLAISGRCFISSYLYNKNANCGECLQPCRKEWVLISDDGNSADGDTGVDDKLVIDGTLPGEKKGVKGHILSPMDLCMVEYIPELIEAGISSFKIEGRARPADYVATVTRVYREAIDSYNKGKWDFNKNWIEKLQMVFNRGFDTGFYFRTPHETSSYNRATYSKQDIGEVVNYYSKVKAAEIRLWSDLNLGEEIIIQGSTTGSFSQTVNSLQVNGSDILIGEKGHNVGILVDNKVRPGDLVYKRVKNR